METKISTAKDTIGCIDAATAILGDKWTPQLLKTFHNEGCMRFCQLQTSVGGINPRTLSARLRDLEDQNIIEKNPTSSDSRCEYRLTKRGEDLVPIIESMHAWSARYASAAA